MINEHEEAVDHDLGEKIWSGDATAIKKYVVACIDEIKGSRWLTDEDEQAVQALLTFYELFRYLAQEQYLWYRFLREQIGIALTTPEDIEYASPPPTHVRRGRPMKRYYKQFQEWLMTGYRLLDEFVHDWYVRPSDKVLLVETEIVIGHRIDGYTSKGLPEGLSIWKYRASISLTDGESLSQINPNGPSGEPVLKSIENVNLAEIGEAIFSWIPLMVDYARRGYAPVMVLPAVKLPIVKRILVPGMGDSLEEVYGDPPEFYYLNPEEPFVKEGHDYPKDEDE